MESQRIIIPKRKFLAGRRIWMLSVIIIIVLIGTGIQMKMTWNRERLRGITSDAVDFIHAAKTDVSSALPSKGELAPYVGLFDEAMKAPVTPIPSNN